MMMLMKSAERTCGYFEDMMRLTETQADPYREALAQARAPCIPILGTPPPPIIIIDPQLYVRHALAFVLILFGR
jgi:hypothetical protein